MPTYEELLALAKKRDGGVLTNRKVEHARDIVRVMLEVFDEIDLFVFELADPELGLGDVGSEIQNAFRDAAESGKRIRVLATEEIHAENPLLPIIHSGKRTEVARLGRHAREALKRPGFGYRHFAVTDGPAYRVKTAVPAKEDKSTCCAVFSFSDADSADEFRATFNDLWDQREDTTR